MGNPVSFAGGRRRLGALGLQMLGNQAAGVRSGRRWIGRLASPGSAEAGTRQGDSGRRLSIEKKILAYTKESAMSGFVKRLERDQWLWKEY